MQVKNALYKVRVQRYALILSFPGRARVLSWAVLNGGFCYADHIINHHVSVDDARFSAEPALWLNESVAGLDLRGTVVAMATAVDMKNLVHVSLTSAGGEVACFATVGCGNALSVGDPSLVTREDRPPLHTINMIVTVQPGLSDTALVEAIQIVTEGRVRALYQAGIVSSLSSLAATGTGTDCIGIASLGSGRASYCGKHTPLGELIGRAAYTAVKNGLAFTADKI
jgi:adenosylcobinamide amidohydrolase